MQNNVQVAIGQVRELRARVLESQLFPGFTARARATGGVIALLAAALMASELYPQTLRAHVFGWGLVCFLGLILNYGDVLLWYASMPQERRELARLRPVADGLPPLVVGAVLTAELLLHGNPSALFGVWMCLFGLTHMSSRRSMPPEIWWLGWYYIACGAIYLLGFDEHSFMQAWPMGFVFFGGELFGAYILYRQRLEE